MYKCEHFIIQELVDPKTYKERGEKAWKLFDPLLLMGIDILRDKWGPCTINDWFWGGKFKWSGLRTKDCKIGAVYSDHRFAQAFDLKFENATPKEIRDWIKSEIKRKFFATKNKKTSYPLGHFITAVELSTPSWTHVARRNVKGIEWIKP